MYLQRYINGNTPVKQFEYSSKLVNNANDPIVEGIVPPNWLLNNFKLVSKVSEPTLDGMVPTHPHTRYNATMNKEHTYIGYTFIVYQSTYCCPSQDYSI